MRGMFIVTNTLGVMQNSFSFFCRNSAIFVLLNVLGFQNSIGQCPTNFLEEVRPYCSTEYTSEGFTASDTVYSASWDNKDVLLVFLLDEPGVWNDWCFSSPYAELMNALGPNGSDDLRIVHLFDDVQNNNFSTFNHIVSVIEGQALIGHYSVSDYVVDEMLAGHSFSWGEIDNGPYAWFIPSLCGNSAADSPTNVSLQGCYWENQLYSMYDSVPVVPCDGTYDSCCVCNGPGEIYECGCFDIPEDDCDCDGNQLDALGACGGSCEADVDADGVCDVDEIFGCTDEAACNYDPAATEEDGSCAEVDECGECAGTGIPDDECDCDGNVLDALGACGGTCEADDDGDGICDDEDDCIGSYDTCGVCNGPGEIYECGCSDILEGECDCDGNQLDALGECGGPCIADADGDGICDDEDDCIGSYDACGVCNGPGEIYECGCSDIPEGESECDEVTDDTADEPIDDDSTDEPIDDDFTDEPIDDDFTDEPIDNSCEWLDVFVNMPIGAADALFIGVESSVEGSIQLCDYTEEWAAGFGGVDVAYDMTGISQLLSSCISLQELGCLTLEVELMDGLFFDFENGSSIQVQYYPDILLTIPIDSSSIEVTLFNGDFDGDGVFDCDEVTEDDSGEEAGEGDCVLGEEWTLENMLYQCFEEGLVVDHNGEFVEYPQDIDNWIVEWGAGWCPPCIGLREGGAIQDPVTGNQRLGAFHFYQSEDGSWGAMDQEFFDFWLSLAVPGEYFCLNEGQSSNLIEWTGTSPEGWPSAFYGCSESCFAVPHDGEGSMSSPFWNPLEESSFSDMIHNAQCGCMDEQASNYNPTATYDNGECEMALCEVGSGSTLSELLQIYFELGVVVDHNGEVVDYPIGIDNWILEWGAGWCGPCVELRENGITQAHVAEHQGLAALHFYQSFDGSWGAMDQQFFDFWLSLAVPGEYFCLNLEVSNIVQQQFMGDGVLYWPSLSLACARECSPQPSTSSMAPYMSPEELTTILYANQCGCLDEEALNFNTDASYDDGGCGDNEDYLNSDIGCMDPAYCNYDPFATLQGQCHSIIQDLFSENVTIDHLGATLSGAQMLQTLSNSSFWIITTGATWDMPSITARNEESTLQFLDFDEGRYILHIVEVENEMIFQNNWLGVAEEGEYFMAIDNLEEFVANDLWNSIWSGLEDLPATLGICPYACTATDFQNPSELYDISLTHYANSECIVSGCTYESALNFDPLAQVDDGSCIMQSLPGGCEDDVDADCICDDIDLCIGYYDAIGVCNGDCLFDRNENGVCDEEEHGCTYPLALNFSGEVYFDDGTCIFDIFVSCPGDYNGDYFIGISDLLMLLSDFNSWCND